jgi:hypothetical protein
VYYGAQKAFDYYAKRYELDNMDYIIGVNFRESSEGYIRDLEKMRGKERVWMLFSHVRKNEQKEIIQRLNKIGKNLLRVQVNEGAEAYLYNLSEPVKL